MDLRRRDHVRKPVTGSLVDLYPHDLQLYRIPPNFSISLAEFEDLAVERLKALRILEQVSIMGHAKNSEEFRTNVIAELKKNDLKTFAKLITGYGSNHSEAALQARKRDHVSHYILRLAYCRSEELRRWFINRELDLFKLRFHALSSESVRQFLKLNELNYSPISQEEKLKLKERLYEASSFITPGNVEASDYFCVPFTDVLDLVRCRKVYLSLGKAYIHDKDFISVLSSIFREKLSYALTQTAKFLPVLEEDGRLFRLLKGLHYSYTGEDYSANKSNAVVRIENLDSLSRQSFPICMRFMHENLRTTHHMKHGGRMQYGLFLKSIGLSLEDALKFWKDEFTKLMDGDKFDKQYSYNIRHNYGKEGVRKNYSAYSCIKIIMTSVGPGDSHGCPFKHYDLPVLKQKMLKYGLPTEGIQEISEYVQKGHYQIACTKYFEVTHKTLPLKPISHPNEYFEESQKVLSGSRDIKIDSGVLKAAVSVKDSSNIEDMWGEDLNISSLNTSAMET